jgi:hypothetical protein
MSKVPITISLRHVIGVAKHGIRIAPYSEFS